MLLFGPGPGPGLVDLYCKKENGSLCLVSWSISINGTGKARTHIVENNNYDEIRIFNRERYIRPPQPLSLNLSIFYSSLSLFHCLFPSLTHKQPPQPSKCLTPLLPRPLPTSVRTRASSSPSRLATPVTNVSFRTALTSMPYPLLTYNFSLKQSTNHASASAPRLPARTLPTLSPQTSLSRLRSLRTKMCLG